MTPAQIQKAAEDWQNGGCVAGQLVFENARTRWAKLDFLVGANYEATHSAARIVELESQRLAAIEAMNDAEKDNRGLRNRVSKLEKQLAEYDHDHTALLNHYGEITAQLAELKSRLFKLTNECNCGSAV